jgi:hypothetical protein
MTKLEKWERHIEEQRLWQSSLLETNHLEVLEKRKRKLREKEKELLKGMRSWVYLKKTPPTKIELAWIIYSQLGWKGYDFDEEELWEDLPETDPLEVMELCQEIEEQRNLGLEVDEPLIEEETLMSLKVVLITLAEEAVDIRKCYFSQNWARKGKKHVGGRIQEIAARTKQPWEILRDERQNSTSLIKKSKEKPPRKEKRVKKQKQSILSSFFGLVGG